MTYETIQLAIPNRINLKLATEIYKPEGDGPFPVVFLFHGFTGYKEDMGLTDISEKLVEERIVSVRFTASGFGDSEGTLIHDNRFSNHRTDADDIYQYITQLSYVDSNRCGVYGHSMGGKLTVLFSKDHDSVRALCAESPPVTFVGTAYEAVLDDWKAKGYFEKVSRRDKRVIRVPYDYVIDVDSPHNDVLKAAESVTSPSALVIAGDLDTEVPWQESKRIFDALKCPKEFVILKGIPHKYSRDPDLIPKVTKPVVQFFVEYLKSKAL